MATNCPNCGRVLKWYNFKADCPECGVSIPNFNWEARLEEDNIRAEEKFAALYKTVNRLKFTVFGTRLRVIRLIVSILPAIGFILPWATVSSGKSTLSFDLIGIFTEGESTIKFFGILFKNIGGIISAMSSEGFGGPVTFIMLGFLMMLLSVIAIIAAFFMTFIRFRKSDTKATWITDTVSIVFAVVSAVIFMISSSKAAAAPFAIATLEFENATVSVLWGTFVYLAFLIAATILNVLVSCSEVTSDEVLEAARAERVRIKEEKEEEERKRKEAARAEAEKRAEEEQAEKVRKAKEALAKKDKK